MPKHVQSPSQAPSDVEASSYKDRVSWLAIWNRDISLEKQAKPKADVAEDVETSPSEEADDDDEEEKEDSQGVLCSCVNTQTPLDKHALARKIGLTQGLLDFTRSFSGVPSGEAASTSPASAVQTVYSQNQRLIFLEPEPGFWLVAAFEHGPRDTAGDSRGHARNVSAASSSVLESPTKRSTAIGTPSTVFSSVTVLRDCLWRAYYGFTLQHGPLSGWLQSDASGETLKTDLREHFQAWLERPLQPMPLGILGSSLGSYMPQSVTETLSQYQLDCAFVLHETGLLHLGSEGICTRDEALVLAEQSMKHLPQQHLVNSVSPPASPSTASSKKASRKRSTLSGPSWKNLGLGGLSGYMTVPSLPGTSSLGVGLPSLISRTPSRSTTSVVPKFDDAPPLPPTMPHIRETSSGWLPSLGLFGKTKVEAASTAEVVTTEETLRSPTSDYGDVAAEANAFASHIAAPDARTVGQTTSRASTQSAPDVQEAAPSTPPPVASKPIEVVEARDVYLTPSLDLQHVTIVKHDNILFAFLGDVSDDAQTQLRDACIRSIARDVAKAADHSSDDAIDHPRVFERLADPSHTAKASSTVMISDTASASTATPRARDAIAAGAMSHISPYHKLSFKEIFVRASSLQWIYASPDSPNKLDIKLLPKSVGKEGSLADADVAVAQQHLPT